MKILYYNIDIFSVESNTKIINNVEATKCLYVATILLSSTQSSISKVDLEQI